MELELAEPDTEPEPAELEPEKMKILNNPQKSKKVQKSIQNQKITSPHQPKSKNNIAPPRQKERVGAPWGPRGPPSLFGGVGRCYSLILDGGGMLFFDLGWIFELFRRSKSRQKFTIENCSHFWSPKLEVEKSSKNRDRKLFTLLKVVFFEFFDFWGLAKIFIFWSKPEPAEPEPVAVGTDPNRTEPWVS